MPRASSESGPAGLRDPNGELQQKPTLTSTTLKVLSWSKAISLTAAQATEIYSNRLVQSTSALA
jgi:hypothetical protein